MSTVSSFNAQPKAPAHLAMYNPRAGAFGWALNK